MNFDLRNKVAVITGAAQGIGHGIARMLVEQDVRVLLVDREEDKLFDVAKRLGRPEYVTALRADIAQDDAGERIALRCIEHFGRLDILVNNAGIYPTAPVMKLTPEVFDRVVATNLRGLVFASKAAAARMIDRREGGRIINISSIDSFHPSGVGLTAYDASKGGVRMFTASLALELAPHRILVNAIAPGVIEAQGNRPATEGIAEASDTTKARERRLVERVPLGRLATPDDIAKVVCFLASDGADYITGTTIVVDGGRLLS